MPAMTQKEIQKESVGKEKIFMSDRAFIDTNILVYAIDKSAGKKQERSRQLIAELARARKAYISTQVIAESYNAATKKLSVPPHKARRWIEQVENMEVVQISVSLIKQAIDCSILNQISFWDGLIIVSAEEAGCETLYTEDLNPGQIIRGVRIVSPF
jgi:predicted nucleic acid-binding protein